jgi:hypothetical protein
MALFSLRLCTCHVFATVSHVVEITASRNQDVRCVPCGTKGEGQSGVLKVEMG